jgi:hypothetical protein
MDVPHVTHDDRGSLWVPDRRGHDRIALCPRAEI